MAPSRSSSRRSCTYSNSSDRSHRGSRRNGGTSHDLRRKVLKKNAMQRMVDSFQLPSPTNLPIFYLTDSMIIRVKKIVHVEIEKVAIYTTLYIYHQSLEGELYSKELEMQVAVKHEKMYWPDRRNSRETISQTYFYSRKMIRMVRDVVLNKTALLNEWTGTDTRGTVSGFRSRIDDLGPTETSIETRSKSEMRDGKYSCVTRMAISYDEEEKMELALKLMKCDYKMREEHPYDEGVEIAEEIMADAGSLQMINNIILPAEFLQKTGSYVEETRQYIYNPEKNFVGNSDKTWRSNRSMDTSGQSTSIYETPQAETPQVKNKKTSENSIYGTPTVFQKSSKLVFMAPLESSEFPSPSSFETPESVHPIAIPGPQSLSKNRPPPRLQLSPSPKKKTPSSVNVTQAVDSIQPRMTVEVTKKAEHVPHKHVLTLATEIGGEPYEFVGNITYDGPTTSELIPKRFLVDGKLLWEQSNDWNPTSITSSQINMTLNSTQRSNTTQ